MIFADVVRHRRHRFLTGDHKYGQNRRTYRGIIVTAVVNEAHVSADVADRSPWRVVNDLSAPFAQGITTTYRPRGQRKLAVVYNSCTVSARP